MDVGRGPPGLDIEADILRNEEGPSVPLVVRELLRQSYVKLSESAGLQRRIHVQIVSCFGDDREDDLVMISHIVFGPISVLDRFLVGGYADGSMSVRLVLQVIRCDRPLSDECLILCDRGVEIELSITVVEDVVRIDAAIPDDVRFRDFLSLIDILDHPLDVSAGCERSDGRDECDGQTLGRVLRGETDRRRIHRTDLVVVEAVPLVDVDSSRR